MTKNERDEDERDEQVARLLGRPVRDLDVPRFSQVEARLQRRAPRLILAPAAIGLIVLGLVAGNALAARRAAVPGLQPAAPAQPSETAGTSPASYQPFTATITYWMRDEQGRHPEGITQTVLLQYTDARHWTTTTTGNSAAPEYVGSHGSVNGNTVTSYDALTKATSSSAGSDTAVSVPDRWLVPGIEAFLEKKGWTNTDVGTYEQTSGKSVESLRFDSQGRPLSYQISSAGVTTARTTYQYQQDP